MSYSSQVKTVELFYIYNYLVHELFYSYKLIYYAIKILIFNIYYFSFFLSEVLEKTGYKELRLHVCMSSYTSVYIGIYL
jgi:hypothetical protein